MPSKTPKLRNSGLRPPAPHLPLGETLAFMALALLIVAGIIYCAPPPGTPDVKSHPGAITTPQAWLERYKAQEPTAIPANYNHPDFTEPREPLSSHTGQ